LRNKNTSIVKILISLELLNNATYILTFYGLSTSLERLWHPHGHKLQQVPKVCVSPTLKGFAGAKKGASATFLGVGS
jgi:hypothetical protein